MSNLRARLAKMPYDQKRATLASLPAHLAKAVKAEQLKLLLTNFTFIEAKVSELDPQQLIEDYDLAFLPEVSLSESIKGSLKLIQGAIQLSANILIEEHHQIAGHLIGAKLAKLSPGAI
ncbi:MAG: hypothetical protein F6J86_31120 [Symploca sp. SIO1B1]|nr:hypothetical protein [Symploca sp. SIO1B1]